MNAFLPAFFGLLGTIVGGVLTMLGQKWAEHRAAEKRSEEHYENIASELIEHVSERLKYVGKGLELLGDDSRECFRKANNEYPLSELVLRAQTAFPELSKHIEDYASSDFELMRVGAHMAHQDPQEYNQANRQKLVEDGVAAAQPLLAGLARARAELLMPRPKRLKADSVRAAADKVSLQISERRLMGY